MQDLFLRIRFDSFEAQARQLAASRCGGWPDVVNVINLLKQNTHCADPPPASLDYLGRFDAEIRSNRADLVRQARALERHRRPGFAPVPSDTYAALLEKVLRRLSDTIRVPRFGLPGGPPSSAPDPAAVKEACDVCKLVMVCSLLCAICTSRAIG